MKQHSLVQFQLNCFRPSFFTLAAKPNQGEKKPLKPQNTTLQCSKYMHVFVV